MNPTTHTNEYPVPASDRFRAALPALALFLLSPLIAEFLLGNIAIDAFWTMLIIAPLYGGGAVLVRELARRAGRGWPTIMLLALAYAVLEEGMVTQSLFSPTYFGFALIQEAHIPALGIGGWWTIFVLTLHTVWSIAVPIALVETFAIRRATVPWLGLGGLLTAGAVFVLGAAINFYFTYQQERFVASAGQWAGTTLVVAALVWLAFAARSPAAASESPPPSVWIVAAFGLLASSAFKMMRWFLVEWSVVAGYLILFTLATVIVLAWSRRRGWGYGHRLALAGGAVATYAWHSFVEQPIIGSAGRVDFIGNVIFSCLAAALLLAAAIRTRGRAA